LIDAFQLRAATSADADYREMRLAIDMRPIIAKVERDRFTDVQESCTLAMLSCNKGYFTAEHAERSTGSGLRHTQALVLAGPRDGRRLAV
jgi:ribonuclease HII